MLSLKSFDSNSRLVQLVHCLLRCHNRQAGDYVIEELRNVLNLAEQIDVIEWISKYHNHIYLYVTSVIGFDSTTPVLWSVQQVQEVLATPYIYPTSAPYDTYILCTPHTP